MGTGSDPFQPVPGEENTWRRERGEKTERVFIEEDGKNRYYVVHDGSGGPRKGPFANEETAVANAIDYMRTWGGVTDEPDPQQ